MKKILLPTDFSNNAWNALFTALKLFDRQVCEFLILHTYQPEAVGLLADRGEKQLWELFEDLKKESEARMAEVMGYLEKEYHNPHHRFRSLCLQGELTGVIRDLSEKEAIDMVVMGTQGATGAKRVFMGSNTVRVIRSMPRHPVLAVPQSYDLQRVQKVLFPTAFLDPLEDFELRPLLEIVESWKAELLIVYVASEFRLTDKQEGHKKQLEQLLEGVRHRFREVPLEVNISKTLAHYAREKGADLIALVHHKHPFFDTIIHEPVVKRVAFETEFPLLILPLWG
jgi:nucleotide-binding universal stress UspA family protein